MTEAVKVLAGAELDAMGRLYDLPRIVETDFAYRARLARRVHGVGDNDRPSPEPIVTLVSEPPRGAPLFEGVWWPVPLWFMVGTIVGGCLTTGGAAFLMWLSHG